MLSQLDSRELLMAQEPITEKVRTDVFQAITLNEIAKRLGKIDQQLSELTPEGIAESIIIILSGNNLQQIRPFSPWFSVSIYNDSESDSSVQVMINKDNADKHTIESDETYDVDMKSAKITAVYLKTVDGGSATVKISAIR